ncbi:MAG: tetratricopeptide repeat protein [Armatimonadetes bacterium]|nr:tetratricopeptide repeat protein [Armatimonadota bacterium]
MRIFGSKSTRALALSIIVIAGAVADAQDLMGGKEVVRRQMASSKNPELGALQAFVDFSNDLPKLNPQEAGRRWADLLGTANNPQLNGYGNYASQYAMTYLPPPTSWPSIAAELDAKKAKKEFRLVAAVLNQDKTKQRAIIDAIAASPTSKRSDWDIVLQFASIWRDEALMKKAIYHTISLGNAESAKAQGSSEVQGSMALIPDLTRNFGKDKAKAMILDALKMVKMPIEFSSEADRKMAIALCRQSGSTFPIHHCELIQGIEDADLYPLFNKWFPKSTGPTKVAARALFIFSKIIVGQGDPYVKEASILSKVGYNSTEKIAAMLAMPKVAKVAVGYFEKALTQNPKLDLWSYYGPAAFSANRAKEMIPILQSAMAKVPSEEGGGGRSSSIPDLLIQAVSVTGTSADVANIVLSGVKAGTILGSKALVLGDLLNRKDLSDAGLKATKKEEPEVAMRWLIDQGKYGEAEQLAVAGGPDRYYQGAGMLNRDLIRLYAKVGRDQDVVDLLDLSPEWGVPDLRQFADSYNGYGYSNDESETPLLDVIAKSFIRLGKVDTGMKLVQVQLDQNNKDDDAYQLLVDNLKPEDALIQLDQMFAGDMFEERPLIWKAIIFERQGKLDDAEKTAREAISIDPSDGDMGHGKRMLGYKVLSEVLAKKGDAEGSKTYKSVVDAIRLSERGDDFLQAGLMKEAISMYSDSLKIFSDAYCIQSRMAVNLANEGKTAEAIEHFRKAFELMPDSFGRVETHCFGCEGVFTTGPAEGVAETVLTEAAKKNPTKPQSQYLLGYLRMEEDRYPEAAQYFKKAVELDPDYLNAWKQYSVVADGAGVSSAEGQRIMLNLIRLDPRQRHGYGYSNSMPVSDFAQIYLAFQKTTPRVPSTESVYPLRASQAATRQGFVEMNQVLTSFSNRTTPGSQIAKFEPIQTILQSAYGDGEGTWIR